MMPPRGVGRHVETLCIIMRHTVSMGGVLCNDSGTCKYLDACNDIQVK